MDFGSLDEAERLGGGASEPPRAAGCARNASLGRPARASSVKGPGREAANAVDGNPATRWTSAYADDQWLSVDLGEVHELFSINVRWEAAYATIYLLQGSLDGLSWATLASAAGREGWVQTVVQMGSLARWVRVYGKRRATTYGFSIWELDVLAGRSEAAAAPGRALPMVPPYEGDASLADVRLRVVGGLSGEHLCDARVDASGTSLRVRDVKRLIAELEGTPACEQKLARGGRPLHDGEAIGAIIQQGAAAAGGSAGNRSASGSGPELELLMLRLPPGRARFLKDVEQGSKNIWDLPVELQEEHEFVLAAVRHNVVALKFAPQSARDDRDLALALVREQSEALRYVSDRLKHDPEVVLAAVEQNPAAIQLAASALRASSDVMLAAMRHQRSAIHFADPELLADSGFRAAAEATGVFRDPDFGHLLQITPDEAQDRRERGVCVFLDARNEAEFAASHILGARHKSDMARFDDVPQLRRGFQEPEHCVVVYSDNGLEFSRCVHYARSVRQNPQIQAHRVLRLIGGLNAWKLAGHPVCGDTRLMLNGQFVRDGAQEGLFQALVA